MLCVLFLGARMRALQMDPKHGNPQRWAQNCFFLCTSFGCFSFRQVLLKIPGVCWSRVSLDVHIYTAGQELPMATNVQWIH